MVVPNLTKYERKRLRSEMVVPNLKTNEKHDVGFTCNRLRAGTNSKTCIFFERQKSHTVGRSVAAKQSSS